jgi:hypothetical protein
MNPMLPNEKKRQMKLSVLSMLRSNGMPSKAGLLGEDETEDEDETLLASNDEESKKLSPEEEKKKKKEKEEAERRPPNLNSLGVESMKNAFRRSRY